MKAFPLIAEDEKNYAEYQLGMDLRDYFAAKYMQGLCSNPTCTASFHVGGLHETAEWSYKMADAMMKAREQ